MGKSKKKIMIKSHNFHRLINVTLFNSLVHRTVIGKKRNFLQFIITVNAIENCNIKVVGRTRVRGSSRKIKIVACALMKIDIKR